MSLRLVFTKHCDSIYGGGAFKEYRAQYKGSVKIRPAIPMPFTREEFRAWIENNWFKGNVDAPIPCFYCRRWIDAGTFSLDHDVPKRDGGSDSFDNLKLCCKECNSFKGDLPGEVFMKYRLLLDREFDPIYRNRIIARQRMGAGYKRVAFIARNESAKVAALTGRAPRSKQIEMKEDF